jgi:anti-sigma regulatory factor (Ser/Thr protein kinase)
VRAQVTYPAGLENITLSRRFTEHWLGRWECDGLVADAQLLVSELVSNALMHAATEVTLTLDLDQERLRIEVEDGGADLPPLGAVVPEAASGRGLLIVDRVASRWGTMPAPDGKVVWAELGPSPSS